MPKSRRFWFALVGVLILCVAGIALFAPRPIIKDPDSVQIIRIQYNPYVNQNIDGMIEVSSYNPEQILDCLSRYKERLTLSKAKGYWMGDVEMEIVVSTADGLKDILLGNVNYTYESYNTFKSEIIDPETLLLELKNFINLSASNESTIGVSPMGC